MQEILVTNLTTIRIFEFINKKSKFLIDAI
jgi:hypothetical protein